MSTETAWHTVLSIFGDDEEQDEPFAGQDHSLTLQNLFAPLYVRLRGPTCFVAAELRLYRDPHNLHDWREPDLMVALDIADRVRPRYLLWIEGKAPDLVVELLSDSSTDNGDLTEKRDWYRREGVREYVVIDPFGRFAPVPRLQAWRFPATPEEDAVHVRPGLDGVLPSAVIPFGWMADGDWVRVVDLSTREVLPLFWEVEPRLQEEIERRRALEVALRDADDRAREAQERALAAEAHARAEAEARQELVAEVERLRRQLERPSS